MLLDIYDYPLPLLHAESTLTYANVLPFTTVTCRVYSYICKCFTLYHCYMQSLLLHMQMFYPLPLLHAESTLTYANVLPFTTVTCRVYSYMCECFTLYHCYMQSLLLHMRMFYPLPLLHAESTLTYANVLPFTTVTCRVYSYICECFTLYHCYMQSLLLHVRMFYPLPLLHAESTLTYANVLPFTTVTCRVYSYICKCFTLYHCYMQSLLLHMQMFYPLPLLHAESTLTCANVLPFTTVTCRVYSYICKCFTLYHCYMQSLLLHMQMFYPLPLLHAESTLTYANVLPFTTVTCRVYSYICKCFTLYHCYMQSLLLHMRMFYPLPLLHAESTLTCANVLPFTTVTCRVYSYICKCFTLYHCYMQSLLLHMQMFYPLPLLHAESTLTYANVLPFTTVTCRVYSYICKCFTLYHCYMQSLLLHVRMFYPLPLLHAESTLTYGNVLPFTTVTCRVYSYICKCFTLHHCYMQSTLTCANVLKVLQSVPARNWDDLAFALRVPISKRGEIGRHAVLHS